MNQTELLLRKLGANAKYQGFRYLIFAVEIVMEDESCLLMLHKGLYPTIAKHFDVGKDNIERNLRTLIDVCWHYGDRNLLNEIAGRKLNIKPSAGEFIDLLASFIKEEQSTFELDEEDRRIFRTYKKLIHG